MSGEPLDHIAACQKVYDFLQENKKDPNWHIDLDVHLEYDYEFIKQLPRNRTFKAHKADITIDRVWDFITHQVFRPIAVIEMNGKHGFYYKTPHNTVLKGTPTKHDNPNQKRNDKIVKNWCERKKIPYIVLLKEETLGDCGKNGKDEVDTEPYLRKKLKEFIR